MTAAQYKSLRQRIGTQTEVAKLLGLTRSSILRRENGEVQITDEMMIAIKSVKHKPTK